MTEKESRFCDYSRLFKRNIETGLNVSDAAIKVAEVYLDGKPARRGKHKISSAERDAAFWSCDFLITMPDETWQTEPFVLALARYMSQEHVSNMPLLKHVATIDPKSVRCAIRYSGLVLRKDSPRRVEIDRLATKAPEEFGEFVRILEVFDRAYRERQAEVDRLKRPLSGLTPLELLVYASLYAFEFLVPRDLLSTNPPIDPDNSTDSAWEAINDLLIWKLGSSREKAFRLSEKDIGRSLSIHLSPFLFPSPSGRRPREDLDEAFRQLLAAQIELNSFITRSADAFSYDDGIRFALKDERLEIVKQDPAASATWNRNGERLQRLSFYWLYRAMDQFVESEMATVAIGKPENQEANRLAYIRTMRTHLLLTEVYGLADRGTVESGLSVDLFQALLSLELMSAFFNRDFLQSYLIFLAETGDVRMALGRLAFNGLHQLDIQNRFPLTWSDRSAKIANIKGWTVNKDFPQGNSRKAEAILDFWTSDWSLLARRLRKKEPGLQPMLFERPILKMGRYLFQLPWVVGIQNNATAAINNLRRIGGRRAEAREETRRIEARLARCFENRGFFVLLNYQPDRDGDNDPGEVDLICAQDGQIIVLEIKSTFLRRTRKDAWLHGVTTLRKAGLQLHRKVQAVEKALTTQTEFVSEFGFTPNESSWIIRGWIVDTSIEHDHERFNGFLKVSLEEILIALRDDRHLLNDPGGLLDGRWMDTDWSGAAAFDNTTSLYPDGFSASRFVDVIESEAVWERLGADPSIVNAGSENT